MKPLKEFEFLGVRIVGFRCDRARSCIKVVHEKHGYTYILLRDGSVATTNERLFKRHSTGHLQLAEALYKLRAIDLKAYKNFLELVHRKVAVSERAEKANEVLRLHDELRSVLPNGLRVSLETIAGEKA